MLNGNSLKLIGAVFMLIDHIGLVFFPDMEILRILGRLAYPIFAFKISEGCRHTHNKTRYILNLIVVAIVCQVASFIYERSLDMCIMVTFTLSVAVGYCVQRVRSAGNAEQKIFRTLELAGAVIGVLAANVYFDIDYGFLGCIIPALPLLFTNNYMKRIAFGAGLVLLSWDCGGIQWYSLLALPIIGLYDGTRGKYNIKYFFYVFYPAHLLLLEIIKKLT